MPRSATRRRVTLIAAMAVLIGFVAAGGYGLWYVFLRPGGPAAVSSSNVAIPSTAASTAATAVDSAEPLGINGTWRVDRSIGSFADFSGSFVGYRVQEQLARIGGNIAVGRTPDVSGSVTISGSSVTSAEITADLSTLHSDDSRRDGVLEQQSLETSRFPTATFKLTEPIELPGGAASGEEVEVTAHGDLTLHGQTQTVEIPLTGRLEGGIIVLTGSLDIAFADYGIDPPQSFVVLSVDDHGILELQLFLARA